MSTLADSVGKELKSIAIFIGVVWAVFLASCFLPLDDYGLKPRSVVGLVGIVTMPFLHADVGHLLGNTLPLIFLLLLLAGSRARSWQIVAEIAVTGGVLLWIGGRSTDGAGAAANHIGASGLVSGLIVFLILGGVFERRPVLVIVAVVTFVLYGGSLLWGLVPHDRSVSWDGHLFGAIGGGVLAFLRARRGKRRSIQHQDRPAA